MGFILRLQCFCKPVIPVSRSAPSEAPVTLIAEWDSMKGLHVVDLSFESSKTLRIIITAFNRFLGLAAWICWVIDRQATLCLHGIKICLCSCCDGDRTKQRINDPYFSLWEAATETHSPVFHVISCHLKSNCLRRIIFPSCNLHVVFHKGKIQLVSNLGTIHVYALIENKQLGSGI